MTAAPRVLLIEDDRTLAPLVRRYLEDHGLEVRWAEDGDRGWREVQAFAPDLVVLDLMLPGRDGLTLCRDIRARGGTGILMLTARGDETDRVVGLELGADDYLSKPFSLRELLARIRAVLRRTGGSADEPRERGAGAGARAVEPFVLDPEQRTLTRDGRAIELTRSEFDLLELLTRRPGRVYRREELLERVRGGETEAYDRAVDTHVSNLRRKLEADPKNPELIATVWGVGYRWAGR